MKKVFWIGPIVPVEDVGNYQAISAAANVWQMGFIDGLIKNGAGVTSVSYVPYPTWPKGPFWAERPKNLIAAPGLHQVVFGYLNVAFIREFWIAFRILFLFLKSLPEVRKRIVFTYNPYMRHRFSAKWLRLAFQCKWVSIIADNKTYGDPDYFLFLSYNYFKEFPKPNKLFCDGGIMERNFPSVIPKPAKSIVFAGSVDKWTGVFDLMELYNSIDSGDHILHVYGKGEPEILESKNEQYKGKIILHGFISDEDLDQVCRNAYAFINPRPVDLFRSENNFPSKLLLYLSYNKPVISTKTKGLSPDYDDVLLYYHDSASLSSCLEEIASEEVYKEIVENVAIFNPKNTWYEKVKKITNSLGLTAAS